MAAINAGREIEKVEASLNKLNKELMLATALTKRYEAKASASTFNGYTAEEEAEYQKQRAILERNPQLILRDKQLLAALHASKEAKPVFKTAAVGELGEDGVFYIDDEDQYDDLMDGFDGAPEDEDENEEWEKEERDEYNAFETITAQLKAMGFDPASYGPSAAAAKPAASAASVKSAASLLPHEAKQISTGGDNDILKYAKLGQFEAFRNEENIEGIDVKVYKDNNWRTCLHYAADGGCLPLVQYLLEKGLNPTEADEKSLTPLAIAVILQRKDVVEAMVASMKSKKEFVPPSALDPVVQSTALIPDPPRFVMSKGAPALPANKGHNFWGKHQSTVVEGITPIDFTDPNFNKKGVLSFLSGPSSAAANSFYSWLSPMTETDISILPSFTFAIYTPNCDVFSMASLMVGATLLAGPDRRTVSNAVAFVGNVAIAPSFRGGGDAVTIFGLTRTALQNKNAQIAIFTSNAPGPAQVSGPIARIKWYRRTLNTIQLIDNTTPTIVKELYPDFVKYAATLRIDSHLKSLFKGSNQLTLSWVDIKQQGADVAMRYAQAILRLMDRELPKVSECHFLFDGVDQLVDSILKPHQVYVVGTMGNVTDVVILAPRSSRERASADGLTAFGNAAIHVFSLFTSLKEADRLLEMTKIAGSLMGADVFYASNTHGLSEDNMRASMLEEQAAYGTNLFIMKENFSAAVSKMDAKKVFIPFASI